MYSETEDLVRDLAGNAEGVCRAYLSKGRREGSYWIVGDLQNNPGRSLFVRLTGPASGPGAAGKFTEHVAARVMLRWRELARFGGGSRGAGQHNLSAPGGFS
ncbi:putative DNA primase [Donghicola eburneus]|uniref:Putative DNA primase n=1 Tax=Donghicola eburneus TaxID=393278 RepID=A0A1M4MXP9_9RHOB|nr:putative DNA primase [Donghicola eburneus]